MSVNHSKYFYYGAYMDQKPSLSLQDIVVILDILNVASTRNAFRVEEYSTVGAIFQKLSAIVQAAGTNNSTEPPTEELKND